MPTNTFTLSNKYKIPGESSGASSRFPGGNGATLTLTAKQIARTSRDFIWTVLKFDLR